MNMRNAGHRRSRGAESGGRTARFFFFAFFLRLAALPPASAAPPPEDAARLYLKALLQDRAGNARAALQAYDRLLSLDPGSAYLREAAASLALRMGRLDRALSEAQEVARLRPAEPHSHLVLGRVRLARGETEEAARSFEKALDLNPDDDEALLYAANLASARDPRLALKHYGRFLENNPDSREAIARMAELHQRAGDLVSAEQAWRGLLEMDPSDFSARLALAQLYEIQKDTAAAVAAYEACRFLDPENPGVLLRLGEHHLRQGNVTEAEESFRRAAKILPGDPTVNFWLALAAEERKDWPEAARRMEAAAKRGPEPGVFLRLSYYHGQAGRPRQALDALKRLHRLDPSNPDFVYYLAVGYEDADDRRAAVRWLEKALALDPARADVHFRLGVNWDMLKKFPRAETHLRRAVELDPGHATALNYLGYSWADRGVRLEEALALVREAVRLDPDNGAYLDSLGWAYFKLGRLDEAEETLKKAAALAEDALVWEHYGDALLKNGKTGLALEAWREGFLLDPSSRSLRARLEENDRGDGFQERLRLARARENFSRVRSLAGALRVSVSGGSPSEGGGLVAGGFFYYARPQLFRFEFAGPLWFPRVLLVQNPRGLHAAPPELEAQGPERERWLKLLGDVLSGEALRPFGEAGAEIRREKDGVVYAAAGSELALDPKRDVPARLDWADGDNGVSLEFRGWRRVDGVLLPARILCESGGQRVELILDLKRVKLNQVLDASLFDWPVEAGVK
jgi:tetratricopeptide (TPR) repeat protein